MAQHGYLREYDEGWDRGDDRDRERSWRDDRDRSDRDRDQGRGFMFGDRDRERGDDRNLFERMGDRARERFSDDDRQYRGSHGDDWSNRDRGSSSSGRRQSFVGGNDWDRSQRGFRSHQDDHYISWRNRQLEALDRDYDDYCREREQQFHSDFDSWRQNRSQNRGQQRSQQSQRSQQGQSSEDVMELNNPKAEATEYDSTSTPTADATLGTNNSENTASGRI